MSTGVIIAIIAGVAFLALVVYNYYKMKNVQDVKSSDKITQLNAKSFKTLTRSGLVLVDFWAPWCGPCKMMSPILNDLAEEVNGDVKIGKLNVDHNQTVASKSKVRNIPTLVLYRDGQEINRFVGVKTKKFLKKELEKATLN